MNIYQQIFTAVFGIFSLLVFAKGLYQSVRKLNSFGLTPYLGWLGIFVWGDAVVFGLYWFAAAAVSLIFNDWILFLLTVSVFWFVRSLGEMIYWFNQQFSTVMRNPPEKMQGFNLFRRSSIWFIYQIIWQCIMIASIVAIIYVSKLWIIQK